MFLLQKGRCSWSLVVPIASIMALVSVVHFFLFPVIPSLEYFGSRQAQTFCIPVNGPSNCDNVTDPKYRSIDSKKVRNRLAIDNKQILQPIVNLTVLYPSDPHNAVVYRGAPWKADIGRWLSGCHSNATVINVVEEIGGKSCKDDCSGQGICNHELGQCRCFLGFTGEGCSERQQLSCNYPGSDDHPYGPWVASICSTYCDTTRAMCFCGEGTKYPNRPVTEECGFQIHSPSRPVGQLAATDIDWSKADMDILTTNASRRGWCNVDPEEGYSNKVLFKEECNCKYDGFWGRFCEIPVESTCINQCAGHGYCRGGFCQCDNGWFGVDCSIPSVSSSIMKWPQWLRPAQVSVPDSKGQTGNTVYVNAIVEKRRPLIHVYDLPPVFNSLLLEGRHLKPDCVNRLYDHMNSTIWTDQLYGAPMALYESLLASPHRTLNGEEADYFFVPVLDSWIITRADDAPYISMQEHGDMRSSLTLEIYKNAYNHIAAEYPYWNRSSGRDHIWFFSWDEGACYAPKEIWNSMMLVHWGNTNSKHTNSTTAYWADNWDDITSERRGTHPCFDPEKDLVLPAWKQPDASSLNESFWAWPREKRLRLFYFNGNLGPAYENGRPEDMYSMGIRQKVAEEFGSSPNKDGKLGRQHSPDVIVTSQRSENYHEELASSVFCGVIPGDGWSGRMEDSILQGCIPVVIQDGIYLPYENVLNYETFAVRIQEDDIPNMIHILRAINDTEVEYKLSNIREIWQRFLYRDSVMLEAERQRADYGHVDYWASEFSELTEDDAFATFLQVLHYKLHNDPWRQELAPLKKEFGVPEECRTYTQWK